MNNRVRQRQSEFPKKIIGFLDMDSFEVQIYLKEKYQNWTDIYNTSPCILVDPTSHNNRIVSVSPLGKIYGITRDWSLEKAQEKVGTDLVIILKDVRYTKPESRRLRNASLDVRDAVVEYRKNSINIDISEMPIFYSPSDEFYIDLTQEVNTRTSLYRITQNFPWKFNAQGFGQNTHFEDTKSIKNFQQVLTHINCTGGDVDENCLYEFKLLMAGIIIEEYREIILEKTGFYSSGGVSENKTLAKFACPVHKPRGTTILTRKGYNRLSQHTNISELKGIGSEIRILINQQLSTDPDVPFTIKQLQSYDIFELHQLLGVSHEKAISIYNIANGICEVQVEEKLLSNQITAGKANYSNLFIENWGDMKEAVRNLMQEMVERLQEEEYSRNYRVVDKIKVTIEVVHQQNIPGFSIPYHPDPEEMLEIFFETFQKVGNIFKGKIEKITLSGKPYPFLTYG